jgi:hypothetical protein
MQLVVDDIVNDKLGADFVDRITWGMNAAPFECLPALFCKELKQSNCFYIYLGSMISRSYINFRYMMRKNQVQWYYKNNSWKLPVNNMHALPFQALHLAICFWFNLSHLQVFFLAGLLAYRHSIKRHASWLSEDQLKTEVPPVWGYSSHNWWARRPRCL